MHAQSARPHGHDRGDAAALAAPRGERARSVGTHATAAAAGGGTARDPVGRRAARAPARTRTILRRPGPRPLDRRVAGADGHVAVTFTADHLLATSDLVVSRTAGPPLGRRLDPGDAVTRRRPAK